MIDIAVNAAIEAGDAILDICAQDFEVEFKADESPLTTADKAAHKIIVQILETTSYPVLSEESGEITFEERKGWKIYWLVDPLDGTKEFIKKNGEFTVNIALVENGVPTLGIVYVPVQGTLYLGVNGFSNPWNLSGAFKAVQGIHFQTLEDLLEKLPMVGNGAFQRLEVSGTPSSPLRVVASRSHCNEETQAFIDDLEKRYGGAERVSSGSSLKLCMVAEGAADIYPRIAPTMEWDTAAAQAVVLAAGGAVCEYIESLPVSAYGQDAVAKPAIGHHAPCELRYNKENLLNPSFVVSGI